MTDVPDDIKKTAMQEAELFADWLAHGNAVGSLSPYAVAGLADSFARALLAERGNREPKP